MARIARYTLLALISVVLIGCRVSDRQKVAFLRGAMAAVLQSLDEEPAARPEVAASEKPAETKAICQYERNARIVRVVDIKADPEIERLRVRAMGDRDRARAIILVKQPPARI